MSDQSINLTQRRRWLQALLVLAAIKAAWLACDAMPRLFLGDSATYLLAAASNWLPPDRSFTYPLLLRLLVMPEQSPYAVLVVQSLAGLGSAWLVWLVLCRRFGVNGNIALIAAALYACDPAQVFYERMVMAEAFGGLALLATFAATVEYVATARLRWLVALECLGLVSVSLRLNLLPVMLVMGVVSPLLLWLRDAGPRKIVAHLAIALVLLGMLHGGYRHYIARQFNTAPAWSARSGLMELGLVAPLVKPAHLWAEGISPNVLSLLRHELRDPDQRNAQMWSAFGLADVLGANDNVAGDALAGRIARRALRDDPQGLVRLGISNLQGYFDSETSEGRMRMDRASEQPYGTDVQVLARKVLNTDVAGTEKVDSPARQWFTSAAPWLVCCWLALVPLAAIACLRLCRNGSVGTAGVLLLYAMGLASSQLLFSAIVSYRYLHPMPAFVLIALAVIATMGTALQRPLQDAARLQPA